MAVATADTWGTEIGVLSQRKPRSILTGQIVPRGTSGGVTLLGTSATILGGLAIGAAGLLLLGDWRVIPLGMIGGVSGATIDSLLGARWQDRQPAGRALAGDVFLSCLCGGDREPPRTSLWQTN
jgi:uncharacterized protein (TIGR00297 family)